MTLFLLDRGARVTIVNNKGQSPHSLALSHCSEEVCAAILRAEAKQQRQHAKDKDTTDDADADADAGAGSGSGSGSDDAGSGCVVNTAAWCNYRETHSDGRGLVVSCPLTPPHHSYVSCRRTFANFQTSHDQCVVEQVVYLNTA